jgi:hypothetical protein
MFTRVNRIKMALQAFTPFTHPSLKSPVFVRVVKGVKGVKGSIGSYAYVRISEKQGHFVHTCEQLLLALTPL